MKTYYGLEKLTNAVHGMATSFDTLQIRLGNAANKLVPVKPGEDLPDAAGVLMEKWMKNMTVTDPIGQECRIQATVAALNDDMAKHYVHELIGIYHTTIEEVARERFLEGGSQN